LSEDAGVGAAETAACGRTDPMSTEDAPYTRELSKRYGRVRVVGVLTFAAGIALTLAQLRFADNAQ
jgi:hypothetical protein